ncbi:polyphosphate kinase 2 family protein [Marinobacterium arenosum]|uniref:polyphosphate kinase 2 family protein n=1 Tax=Marinobacterium arenosum TaxID=2862496 RepID=UPI001C972905|nr:polyphosphate kinase [Marinobacterium arenosum]MBY4677625.1 polyphosphate kinase [Marinobacterium arenosum]
MYQPSEIVREPNPPRLAELDLTATIADREQYLRRLKKWQKRMQRVQQAYYHQNRRAIIVFEGWDASGKGGAIRRLGERLDPRGYKVHPVGAPTEEEQGRHYLYRFQNRLPIPGTLSIFDRSWYGRVLVERIEGYANKRQWQRAYQEINEFERMLVDDGVRIIKLFLHIDSQEQLRRFQERLNNPYKRWKLTHEDIRNRARWADYETATDQMFAQTSTEQAPWRLISANHKWYARVAVLKTVTKALEKGVDVVPPPIDPKMVEAAWRELGLSVD